MAAACRTQSREAQLLRWTRGGGVAPQIPHSGGLWEGFSMDCSIWDSLGTATAVPERWAALQKIGMKTDIKLIEQKLLRCF